MPAIKKPPLPNVLPKARQKIEQVVGNVKAGLPKLPERLGDEWLPGPGGLPPAGEIELALAPLRQTRVGKHRGFAALEHHLNDVARRGGTLQAFREELAERAQAALRSHRRLVDAARQMAAPLERRDVLVRFRNEVLQPACRGMIGGDEAWSRTQQITGRDVRKIGREAGPSCTFGIGVNVEMAAIASVQAGRGIGSLLWQNRGWYEWFAVGLGCHLEGDFTVVVSFQLGPPAAGESLTVNVGVGAAYGLSLSLSALFVPIEGAPVSEWPFTGLDLTLGGGAGVEISLAVQVCSYYPFSA